MQQRDADVVADATYLVPQLSDVCAYLIRRLQSLETSKLQQARLAMLKLLASTSIGVEVDPRRRSDGILSWRQNC